MDRGYLAVAIIIFDSRVRVAVGEFRACHVDFRGHPLQIYGKVGDLTWWVLRHTDNTEIFSTSVDGEFFTVPPGSSPAGCAALQAAIQEMREGAREVGANNSGPSVEKYLNGITASPADWCAKIFSWCFSRIPEGIPFKYHLGARNMRNQFKQRGWTYDPQVQSPEPGNIITWWRRHRNDWRGHMGSRITALKVSYIPPHRR